MQNLYNVLFLELLICVNSFCFLKTEAYNSNPILPLLLVPEWPH